jgi:integrase
MGVKEVSVFKVGTVFHYRYTVDGRRIQRTTRETSRGAARDVAEEAYKAAVLRSRGEEPEPTLGALAEMWIQAHALVFSPSRIKTMEGFLRLHIEPLKTLRLQQLTTRRVEEARAAYLQGHGRESANLWLSCLRALVRWGIKRKMIRFVPWDVKPLKVQRKPKVLLPTAKAGAWMDAMEGLTQAEPGIFTAVALCIGMGLRISEAIEARWEWLDLERCTYTPGDTKGREAWERRVPEWLVGELQARAQVMGPIVLVRPGHPITESRVAYAMHKANQACGILHVTPHRLRGTYATWLSELGVPIQDIQRALGHKDVRTTMRYLEVNLMRVADAQILVGKRLGRAGREKGEPQPPKPQQPEVSGFCRRILKGQK